jgi:hypothetical protein
MSSRFKLLGALLAGTLSVSGLAQTNVLQLPPRLANAPGGTAFAQQIAPLSFADREQEIASQVEAGNVPDFLRRLCPVSITNMSDTRTNIATFFVTPEYLAIGSDEDYFLTPISPNTAQRLADMLGCSLPTPKMVDAIYSAAEVKLPPAPIPPTPAMTTVPVFSNHNAIVRTGRAALLQAHPPGALVAGDKKDVVLSARLSNSPGKVAIYGWHRTNGEPVQPLYLGHTATWVDYSHGIRLVQQKMFVNGSATAVSNVLTDPALAPLLSAEGVIAEPRYRTDQANSTPEGSPRHLTLDTGISTNRFGEQLATFTFDPDVRVVIDAPQKGSALGRTKLLVILYALPNGNTIEQTMGRSLTPGDDWHYDIQHIAAQTRFVRELLPDRYIAIAYLENKFKSWPSWRKQYGNDRIPGLIAAVTNAFYRICKPTNTDDDALAPGSPRPSDGRGVRGEGQPVELVLSGHSGGGSFIFGYLNAIQNIPDQIVRIAFLDSSYAYDSKLGHAEKLARWLKTDDRHFLCVLAYDDANALLDGKSFVSAAGGTWGTSHAMQSDLAREFAFTSRTNDGLETLSSSNGRIQFLLKQNPERKVLHTVQVERNGFIQSLVSGTTNEAKGYEYFGLRAYSQWIE